MDFVIEFKDGTEFCSLREKIFPLTFKIKMEGMQV